MHSNQKHDLQEEVNQLNDRLNKIEQHLNLPRKRPLRGLFIVLLAIFLILIAIGILQFISGGNQ